MLSKSRTVMSYIEYDVRNYKWTWLHLRQGPICDLDEGTYIIVNTCRIIEQLCLQKNSMSNFQNGEQ